MLQNGQTYFKIFKDVWPFYNIMTKVLKNFSLVNTEARQNISTLLETSLLISIFPCLH